MNTPQKQVRAAGEVAARTAGRASSAVLSAADTRTSPAIPPVWTTAEVLSHVDQAWEAVLVRVTQGPDFDIDRAVTAAGHGQHGGWLITPRRQIACGGGRIPCGQVLFPLDDVLSPQDQDEMLRTAAEAMSRRAA